MSSGKIRDNRKSNAERGVHRYFLWDTKPYRYADRAALAVSEFGAAVSLAAGHYTDSVVNGDAQGMRDALLAMGVLWADVYAEGINVTARGRANSALDAPGRGRRPIEYWRDAESLIYSPTLQKAVDFLANLDAALTIAYSADAWEKMQGGWGVKHKGYEINALTGGVGAFSKSFRDAGIVAQEAARVVIDTGQVTPGSAVASPIVAVEVAKKEAVIASDEAKAAQDAARAAELQRVSNEKLSTVYGMESGGLDKRVVIAGGVGLVALILGVLS